MAKASEAICSVLYKANSVVYIAETNVQVVRKSCFMLKLGKLQGHREA